MYLLTEDLFTENSRKIRDILDWNRPINKKLLQKEVENGNFLWLFLECVIVLEPARVGQYTFGSRSLRKAVKLDVLKKN